MKKLIFILLITYSVLSFAEVKTRPISWATPIIGTELENLYQVDFGIYRSAQPDEDDFKNLSGLGIKEILNLRQYHSDDEALEYGFKVHRIKMNAGSVSEQDLLQALKIIVNRKAPILIHCWHGADRTGVTVATYRIVMQGWTKEQALDEMINGGYGYHQNFYPELVDLIKSLDIAKMKQQLDLEMNDSKSGLR